MVSDTSVVHPVGRFAAEELGRLGEIGGVSVLGLSAVDAGEVLLDLEAAAARLDALRLQVVAHADRVGTHLVSGSPSMVAWLAHRCRIDHREARARVLLAEGLESRPGVAAALVEGRIHRGQAALIVEAVGALPTDRVPVETIALAEQRLVDHALVPDTGGPKELRVLGRRILDVVAPELGEAEEARRLAAEERVAGQACRFTMSDDGHGTSRGRFSLPTVTAGALRKHLVALMGHRHQNATGGAGAGRRLWDKSSPERMGEAFAAFVERYPADRAPGAGGLAATVVVKIDLDSLRGECDAPGESDMGERVSPGEVRRIACDAGIIPVVLGGVSQVLDVGRERRFHTKAQRIAIATRDGGCVAEGCDKPPGMSDVHHLKAWAKGGRTTVDDAVLYCPHHHRRAHDPAYATTYLPTGKVRFHRRP